jgi:hypothetical protein
MKLGKVADDAENMRILITLGSRNALSAYIFYVLM